jgi:MerR family transcriptional regulator/heat shock protein HspR
MAEIKESYNLLETCRRLGIRPDDLKAIETEGLIVLDSVQGEKVISDDQIERLEMILRLRNDLSINLAGIDVILDMRGRMLQMRREVEQILEFLHKQISQDLRELLGEENYPMALGPGDEFLAVSRGRGKSRSEGESG